MRILPVEFYLRTFAAEAVKCGSGLQAVRSVVGFGTAENQKQVCGKDFGI
jgi:hypothetical protein